MKLEIAALQGDLDSQDKRVIEVDREVQAHTAAKQMLKDELDSW